MILFFNKTKPNKTYNVNAESSITEALDKVVDSEISNFNSGFSETHAFFMPSAPTATNKPSYPTNIASLFPMWLRKISEDNTTSLINLTKIYYDWLYNYGYFQLEKTSNLEYMLGSHVSYLSEVYLNAIPTKEINYAAGDYNDGYTGGHVDQAKIRSLIDNVKVNLYSRKGTPDSFKYAINQLYGVDVDTISVSYPKKYVLRLNSGKFDWIRGTTRASIYDTEKFTPDMTSGYLNFSILGDGNLWQDYSYVVNTAGLSADSYNKVIHPLVHPAGTLDFFQKREDIFDNSEEFIIQLPTVEIPIIQFYTGYTLGSSTSLAACEGSRSGQVNNYVFPSWDVEISTHPGVTFGNINIGEFLNLMPVSGQPYPNIERDNSCT